MRWDPIKHMYVRNCFLLELIISKITSMKCSSKPKGYKRTAALFGVIFCSVFYLFRFEKKAKFAERLFQKEHNCAYSESFHLFGS